MRKVLVPVLLALAACGAQDPGDADDEGTASDGAVTAEAGRRAAREAFGEAKVLWGAGEKERAEDRFAKAMELYAAEIARLEGSSSFAVRQQVGPLRAEMQQHRAEWERLTR